MMKIPNFFGRNGLKWEKLKSNNGGVAAVYRTAVPGGWLVSHGIQGGLTFIPDENHDWDGESVLLFGEED